MLRATFSSRALPTTARTALRAAFSAAPAAAEDTDWLELAQPLTLMFFGAPGVGKGTFAKRFADAAGIPQVSTGDLIREQIRGDGPLGKQLQEITSSGNLVPDELVQDILLQRLAEDDCKPGYILDGFPRTVPQGIELDKHVALSAVVEFRFPKDMLVEKIMGRRVCTNCGNNYNVCSINRDGIEISPLLPKVEHVCDLCGGHVAQREDDREDVILHRLSVYEEQSAPLLDFYGERDLLHTFDVAKGVQDLPRFYKFMRAALSS
eukprot:PLAT9164.11.p2 GENE.PLAT9164.11~~PLAT9164.11.p2  ORF type:complete len:264 (+),score=119.40 PLAT9164.11:41-832(+)